MLTQINDEPVVRDHHPKEMAADNLTGRQGATSLVKWIWLFFVMMGGCAGPHHDTTNGPSSFPAAHVQTQPAHAPTFPGYCWVRPQADALRLEQQIAALELGSSYEDIIRRLGTPDSEWQADATHLFDRLHRHWGIKYDFARVDAISGTAWDQHVNLYFDSRGRLEMISSTYPGVEHREVPNVWEDARAPGWWRLGLRGTTFPSR